MGHYKAILYEIFVGMVSGQVWLYGERGRERDRERGGADGQKRENPISSTRNSNIIGGVAVFYQDDHPSNPSPNYYQPHRLSGARYQAPGRQAGSQGYPDRHQSSVIWAGIQADRQASSEGSLSLMVASEPNSKRR